MPLVSVIAVVVLLATAFPSYADPPLPSIPATNFNITTFGAVGNGTMNNATAIQNAINAAAAVGGGTVIVAAVGVLTNYLSGPINLTNNVCLQINGGAKLQMLPMSSWPDATISLISGSKLHDIAITGSGIIDGQGTNWWFPLAGTRPAMITITNSSNLLIQGVTLQNPPMSHMVLKGNDANVTIQGMTINTPFDSHNTDSELTCTNVLIRNCSISCGDDNLVTAGSGITISNCFFGVGHGLSIGSSVTSGANNLLVSNCTWNDTEYGIHLKSAVGRAGLVQNLTYLDLTMTNVNFVVAIYSYYDEIGSPSRTINETPFAASTNGVVVTNNIPSWQNILISNVTASTVGGVGNLAGIIWGLPNVLVSNVVLSHVNFTDATNTFCVYNAKGIQFVDCNLAAPAHTNTFTLYNADVTVTNSATNSTPVTLGGLALPPTNNTLAFFNATATVTGTNELGAGAITLGNSTLTLSQFPVAISNSFITPASSTLVFPAIPDNTNIFAGTFNGPLAFQQPVGALQFNGNGTFTGGANPTVIDSLIIGDCGLFTPGFLTISGGFFFVVGPFQPVLDVRDGTLTVSGGLLSAQTLMMTNSCGSFALNGGTFNCGNGTFLNGQPFTVNSGALFNMQGGVQAFGNQLIVANNGTVTGCGTITGDVVVNVGGTMQATCGSGSTLTFSGTVTNNGFIGPISGNAINFLGPVVNNGTIDTSSGNVKFFSTVKNTIPLTSGSYAQNFDSMTSTGANSTTPAGWYIGNVSGTNGVVNGTSVVNDFGNLNSGTNYNYGVAGVSSVTNRALGSLASNTGASRITEVRFLNSTGKTIHNLMISYDGEEWRYGGTAGGTNQLAMFFSIDGTNFTPLGSAFNFTAPVNSGITGPLDGNDPSNRVAGIGGTFVTNLVNGTAFYLRWVDINDVGNDDALAIDNFSLTVLPPSTNSWIASTGKWEIGSNWLTTSAPSTIDSADLITNAGNKTVTIDVTTVLSNALSGCLTISNLTVSAPANNTNTLFLNNAGPATPLIILSNLTLSANAALSVTNSALVVTNGPTIVGSNGVAQLTVSNGTWLAQSVAVAYGATSSQGTLTMAGGTNVFSSILSIGGGVVGVGPAGTGSVWITGGQLTVTNDFTYIGYGALGDGQVAMSNGTWTALGVVLAYTPSSQGTLTLAGGTTTLQLYGLDVGSDMNATGTVWMTGGQLIMTNTSAIIGNFGTGLMTISNGLWQVQSVVVDEGGELISGFTTNMSGAGTLTIAGGTVSMPGGLYISQGVGTTGTVWITGGQLDTGFSTDVGLLGVGRMIVSNGTWQTQFMQVGSFNGAHGTLTIAGGASSAYSKLLVGSPDCKSTGLVAVVGGSLFVTNTSGNAVLDVENGTFTLNSGTVVVDQFVMTNACAHFVRTGGTLIYSSAVLNPNDDTDGDGIPNGYEFAHGLDPLNPADASADNDGDGFSNLQEFLAGTDPNDKNSTPFRTVSIGQQGNNIVLTWTTAGGTTNQVQSTSGTGNGSYATNGFANLSPQMVIGGTGLIATNYTDVGGATNKPSRFYRVRLVP
jgi:polygalacturonase